MILRVLSVFCVLFYIAAALADNPQIPSYLLRKNKHKIFGIKLTESNHNTLKPILLIP